MHRDYDKALEYYKTYQDLGYTGDSTQFIAVNKETSEEEIFTSKQLRDHAVKSKQYIAPKTKNSVQTR